MLHLFFVFCFLIAVPARKYLSFKGNEYYIASNATEARNFTAANHECKEDGGSLASFATRSEAAFVWQSALSSYLRRTAPLDGAVLYDYGE